MVPTIRTRSALVIAISVLLLARAVTAAAYGVLFEVFYAVNERLFLLEQAVFLVPVDR